MMIIRMMRLEQLSRLCVWLAVLHDAALQAQTSSEAPVEGISSPGVKPGFWIHSLKTLLDESINQGLVCAHMHSITWTEHMDFMS